MKTITSRDNPLVKHLHKLLASSAVRREVGRTLLDGPHLVQAYLGNGDGAGSQIFVAEERLAVAEMDAILRQASAAEVVVLSHALFKIISPSDTPTGIVACIPIPIPVAAPLSNVNCVLLEGVQDPGNVGSVLRSAWAAGFSQVYLSPGCADPWSPKCLRGGMGAHFDLCIESDADLASVLKKHTGRALACDPHATDSLFDLELPTPLAVLVGAEGAGLSMELLSLTSHRCRIPMRAGAESLNVSAAAAVVMFEYVRQAGHLNGDLK